MVSTPLPPNNGPTHENEKRRKQTVERARANHLSRQLQMRLQYARLKVQYGWQKQNLNEVENLYFHHSHQRGPKPTTSPSTTDAQNEPHTAHTDTTSPTSNSSHSSLSFKLGPSALSQSHTSDSHSPPQASTQPTQTQRTSTHNQSQLTQNAPVVGIDSSEIHSLIQMKVEPENKPSQEPPIPTTNYAQSPTAGPSSVPNYGAMNFSLSSSSYHSDRSQPIATTWITTRSPPTSSSPNHYPNVPLQRQPTLPASPGAGENPYTFPGVSLTYDSFWSSHSSSTSARSFRSSMGSIAQTHDNGIDTSSMNGAYTSGMYQASPHSGQKFGAGATVGRE
ncbi:hypothetical protein C0991_007913 [Blastosporella zonata]|nr:hypothetical protein C0991_007913 [Blastosporella zonata]